MLRELMANKIKVNQLYKTIIAISLLTISVLCHAAPVTSNDLLSKCAVAVNALDGARLDAGQNSEATECFLYMNGYADALAVSGSTFEGVRICLPSQGTIGQYTRTFVKEAKDHPEMLNKPAAYLVGASLAKNFPCR